MKTAIAWVTLLALLAPAVRAADTDEASVRDVQRLQDDLETLDDELQSLERTAPAEARRLQERADQIREDTVYLKVKMRRHQRDRATGTGVTLGELEELRRDIASLRRDIGTGTRTERRTGEARIPTGTEMSVRLEQSLSSQTATTEDTFRAAVHRAVRIDDEVVIPAGTELRGIVRSVQPAERLQKPGRLELNFDTLWIDGRRVDVRTSVVSMQDEDAGDERLRKTGIGAVLGGVVGGLLKGRTGAMIGVLVGGGAVVAQKGQDVELPEGTIMKVRLERAISVPR